MALTSEEYAEERGSVCPFCGSYELTGDSVEVDGNGASQKIRCCACHNVWVDIYTLIGYEVI